MSNITLTYFDFSASRGEECRIALRLAGLAFTDRRVGRAEWATLKPTTPWGSMPLLEVDGRVIAQSNAILTWIGTGRGLHPQDLWEAARHQAVMEAVEEFRHRFNPAFRESDPEKKKAAREEAVATLIPTWGAYFEAQLGDGPFLGGSTIGVADVKLYILGRWFKSGVLDHVPSTVWSGFPKLEAHYAAVSAAV